MAILDFDTTLGLFRAWQKRGASLSEIRAAIALQQGGSSGSGGGTTGGATFAKQDDQIALLEDLLLALADPATESRQAMQIARLESLLVLLAEQATADKQDVQTGHLENLDLYLADVSTEAKQNQILTQLQALVAALASPLPVLDSPFNFTTSASSSTLIPAPGIGKRLQILSIDLYPGAPRQLIFANGATHFAHYLNMQSIEKDYYDEPKLIDENTALNLLISPAAGLVNFRGTIRYRVLNV